MPSGSENERRRSSSDRLPKLPGASTDNVSIPTWKLPSSRPIAGYTAAFGSTSQRTGSPLLQRRASGSNIVLRRSSRDYSHYDSSSVRSATNPSMSRNEQLTRQRSRSITTSASSSSSSSSNVGLLLSTDRTRHHELAPAAAHRTFAPSPHHDNRLYLVGLRNLGNTCFMNSVIQCLCHTKQLTDLFTCTSLNTKKLPPKNGLVEAFIDLLNKMRSHDTSSSSSACLSPHLLKQRITKIAPRFQGYEQHDSQEFLRFMLDGLHDELNTAKNNKSCHHYDASDADSSWQHYLSIEHSVISDLFVGQLKSTLTCHKCRNSSVTFDPFWDLSLPIPKSTTGTQQGYGLRANSSFIQLGKCLSLFMAQETLDGDNKPMCSHCKSPQTSSKQFTIQRFPEILVLHLKRFTGLMYRTKLNTMINFPKELNSSDLSPYSAAGGSQVTPYQLYAVSNHSGSTYAGHYTAYCRYHHDNKWYTFNDSRYYTMASDSIHTSEAYVLFYQKRINT